MKERKYSSLVFDLDGTISDPSLGIYRCMNYALTVHDLPEVSRQQVHKQIGPPLEEIFLHFCPHAEEPLIISLVNAYRDRYAQMGYAENTLYSGIVDVLGLLFEQGIPMGVCTSKRADFAEKILERFGLRQFFSFVDGGDIGIKKRDQLAGLISANRIDTSAVMIGDRAVDVLAAKVNNIASAGVLWGFGDQEEIKGADPDHILSEVANLTSLV